MRAQYCREHIDETAEACGLEDVTRKRVKKIAEFCLTQPEQICSLATDTIHTLISIQDSAVRDKVISSVSKSLESGKHPITGEQMKKKGNFYRLPNSIVEKVIFREMQNKLNVESHTQNGNGNTTESTEPETTTYYADAPDAAPSGDTDDSEPNESTPASNGAGVAPTETAPEETQPPVTMGRPAGVTHHDKLVSKAFSELLRWESKYPDYTEFIQIYEAIQFVSNELTPPEP